MMRISRILLVVLSALATPAFAALDAPVNPIGPSSVTAASGDVVSVDPDQASFVPAGSSSWLLPALDAVSQPYNQSGDVWDYTFSSLHDDLTLQAYGAWADNAPTVSLGTASFGGFNVQGAGGAAFGITYSPTARNVAAGDPERRIGRTGWSHVLD